MFLETKGAKLMSLMKQHLPFCVRLKEAPECHVSQQGILIELLAYKGKLLMRHTLDNTVNALVCL